MSSANERPGAAFGNATLVEARQGPLAPFIAGDVIAVDGATLVEGSADTVFAGYRLQDIGDYRGALQGWFRAVRIGGHLLVTVPHAFLYERQLALPSRWRPAQRRLYTPGVLMAEVEEALAPNSYRVRWLSDDDGGYDYAADPDVPPDGRHDVLIAIERIAPPVWPLIEVPQPAPIARHPDFDFEPSRTRIEATVLKPHRRILVLKLDHLGDFILGLPALERLRAAFPAAEITLVVGSWNVAMAQETGIADRVLALDAFPANSGEEQVDVAGKTALFQALVTEAYDLAIDLRTDFDTRFLLRHVRAGVRAGIGARSQFPFLDIYLPVEMARHEAEAARAELIGHKAFAAQPRAATGDYRTAVAPGDVDRGTAILWGPYLRLRAGRYMFEPHVEIDPARRGSLLFDIGLDQQRVAETTVQAGHSGAVRMRFAVEVPEATFEFRIWPVRGSPPLGFSFYGGRLIREGAQAGLHQSEYLALLIELVAMRVARSGLLEERGPER